MNANWKIVRTSDSRIQNIAATDTDATLYLPSGTDVTQEEWRAITVPGTGKLFSNGPAALSAYAGQKIWELVPFNSGAGSSASIACGYTFGTDYFYQLFFDASLTSNNYRQSSHPNACQLQAANHDYQKGQAIWNNFTAAGEHTAEVAVSDNNTDCYLGSTDANGNIPIIHDCWIVFKTNAEMEQEFINSPTVPYTNQSAIWTTTLTTPSQSTGLAAARTAIGATGCATAQQYDAALDPTNWDHRHVTRVTRSGQTIPTKHRRQETTRKSRQRLQLRSLLAAPFLVASRPISGREMQQTRMTV